MEMKIEMKDKLLEKSRIENGGSKEVFPPLQ